MWAYRSGSIENRSGEIIVTSLWDCYHSERLRPIFVICYASQGVVKQKPLSKMSTGSVSVGWGIHSITLVGVCALAGSGDVESITDANGQENQALISSIICQRISSLWRNNI